MATKDISDLQVLLAYALRDGFEPPRTPGEILFDMTGQCEKVCWRACERAEHRGLIEVGVSLRAAWLTDKGRELLAGAAAEDVQTQLVRLVVRPMVRKLIAPIADAFAQIAARGLSGAGGGLSGAGVSGAGGGLSGAGVSGPLLAKAVAGVELWQEYDCPRAGIDFDRWDADVVIAGESFYCCGCGGNHVAGVDGPSQTYAQRPGEELRVLPLPSTAQERDAWLRGELPAEGSQ